MGEKGGPKGNVFKGFYDLCLSPRRRLVRHVLDDSKLKKLRRSDKFAAKFKLQNELGRGQFGVTYLCVERSTGRQLACKCIAKDSLKTSEEVEYVRIEIGIMHLFAGHPHVVQLEAAYEDRSYVYLVMELCAGGPLLDRIMDEGSYSEKSAAALFRTIMIVVQECHAHGVMHRDLKPENFLFLNKTLDSPLKATDFGLSAFCEAQDRLFDYCGSPCYIAPEIVVSNMEVVGYTRQADVWSAGVILYLLLSGEPPFWGKKRDIEWEVMHEPLDIKSQPWPKISKEAKDLVKNMLNRDPDRRFTATQVLQHPWIAKDGVAPMAPLDSTVLMRLRNFSAMNKLKKAAFNYIAKNLSKEEIMGLKEMFRVLDKDHDGVISLEELRNGLEKRGCNLSDTETGSLLRAADSNEDGYINYEEFLTATLHMSKLVREDRVRAAFKHFDKDDSGSLNQSEILQALKENNIAVDENSLSLIMARFDNDHDGRIDYEEFFTMMRTMEEEDPLPTAGRILKRRGMRSQDLPIMSSRRAAQAALPGTSAGTSNQ